MKNVKNMKTGMPSIMGENPLTWTQLMTIMLLCESSSRTESTSQHTSLRALWTTWWHYWCKICTSYTKTNKTPFKNPSGCLEQKLFTRTQTLTQPLTQLSSLSIQEPYTDWTPKTRRSKRDKDDPSVEAVEAVAVALEEEIGVIMEKASVRTKEYG